MPIVQPLTPDQIPGFPARHLLDEHCRHAARNLHGGNLMGSDWVLLWAGTLALLRTVGDALCNVDAAGNAALAREVRKRRAARKSPNPPIYWKFIREDRNLLLHEARLRAGQGIMLTPGREPVLSYVMNSGHYAGRDPHDLVDEAIEWWDGELRALGL